MLRNLKSDFKSSIVVFLVALPLCLGIALASQAPLASGLIAGIIGGLVVASFSGSALSVSGPAAGLAVIVAHSIQQLGDFKDLTIAVFLSGLLQIVFSLLKAGKLGNFFPTSVIKGMLSAIGLLLILKQFPHAVGYDADYMGSEEFEENGHNTFGSIFTAFKVFNLGCVILAFISLILITQWDRLAKHTKFTALKIVPSALLAVILGVALNRFVFAGTSLELGATQLVQLPFTGGWNNFISAFSMPDWSALSKPAVYSVALTLAIVGSLESLLSIDAADKIDPEKRITSKNKELMAQGIGNVVSGLAGGLPITAVIVRTSANVESGAKTKLSAIMHGIWLLLAILLIPHLMNQIPLATLATVLILVGYKLTKPELYIKTYKMGLDQFIPFVVTILAILVTDLLKGIAIGMVVGFFFVFRRNSYKAIVMVHDDQKHYLIRFMKDVSFLQKDNLSMILQQIPDEALVTIDGSHDVFVDSDIVDLLEDFIESAPLKNIKVDLRKSSTALSPFFRIQREMV